MIRQLLIGMSLVTLFFQRTITADSPHPNIILMVVDDFGWADLQCYGSKYHRTPNTDRMASEGMRFTQAYAACPVCSPTRAAIMTGKYPARLHLTDWLPGRADRPDQKLLRPVFRQELPLQEVTIAEVLQTAGYATATIGKWHLGGEGYLPQQQGFDLNVGGDHAGSPLNYFAPYERNGRTMPGLESAQKGEYLTDRLFDEAAKFIEANQEGPFFLYLPHYAVHTPMMAKAELQKKYRGNTSVGRQNNPIYAAMIESFDQGVGRLRSLLEKLAITESTVIVFTSDNGGLATVEGKNTPATNNAPLREGKGYLYEGGIRVPLIVRWPGRVKPGSVCDVPVSSIDLLPTIAEICGFQTDVPIDGVSLVPPLQQMGDLDQRPLYWHYPHYSNQGGKPGSAIRDGDYKLIEFFEDGRQELFNVRKDPSESRNLIEENPDEARRLSQMLTSWRREVDAQTMRLNPDYVANPQQRNGVIRLPASTAAVHGVMLRYEPLPHKNTLGYWVNPQDWASWDFTVTIPGTFRVVVSQGCGNGSGGSKVTIASGDQSLPMTVEETGGFQQFRERDLGTMTFLKKGVHTLSVKPSTKPGQAVMDLREIRLLPAQRRKSSVP